MTQTRRLLPLLAKMTDSGPPLSLTDAALATALSPSYAQRVFAAHVGESPTKYQQRLRLERGAIELRSSDARIIDIAMAVGFQSHEAFTRAFKTHFGVSPRDYRNRSVPLTDESRGWASQSGRCIGLYHLPLDQPESNPTTTNVKENLLSSPTVIREPISETPTLVSRRRVERARIAEALAECLPMAYGYAMEHGLAMAGPPFVWYHDQSPAFFEIEAGIPLVEPAEGVEGPDLFAGTLPGGEAAVATHVGPYESLGETHIALDKWINDNDVTATAGPWEVYLTDPGEVPDPNDWQTKIIWPIEG